MPIWHSLRSGSLSTRCMGNEMRGTANHFPTESAGGVRVDGCFGGKPWHTI